MKFKNILIITAMMLSLTGCMVDQTLQASTLEEGEAPRIIATSFATMQIMDALDIDLVGRSQTSYEIPERYKNLEEYGTAMAPDAEKIALSDATHIIGPDTLIDSIKPTYDQAGIEGIFIDLQSVDGMYKSITQLGDMFGREEQAKELVEDYEKTVEEFLKEVEEFESPKVLTLMGLPGAYIGATDNSYVGSTVTLAGATNVIQVDTEENYVSWNTEELVALDPDIILLTAHGIPEMAMEMFADEFANNDVWKNFRAVQEGKVYQLEQTSFGMSATFGWRDGLYDLKEILYTGDYESFVE